MKRVATLLAATIVALTIPIPTALAACHIAQFSPGEYDIKENGGKVTIGVQNPGPAGGDRTVDWETVNGSAKAGSDFVAGSGTLSFTPADTSKVIEVTIVNNALNEPKETFTVRLIARPGSCISQDSIGPPATVTINDDDPKPTIPKPTKTQTPQPSPTPTRSASPSPTPTRTRTTSPSPSPSPTASPSVTPIAAPEEDSDGGLSGGALAGIVAGVVALGGGAAFWVRRRFFA